MCLLCTAALTALACAHVGHTHSWSHHTNSTAYMYYDAHPHARPHAKCCHRNPPSLHHVGTRWASGEAPRRYPRLLMFHLRQRLGGPRDHDCKTHTPKRMRYIGSRTCPRNVCTSLSHSCRSCSPNAQVQHAHHHRRCPLQCSIRILPCRL